MKHCNKDELSLTASRTIKNETAKSEVLFFEVSLNIPNKKTLSAMKDVTEKKNITGPFNSVTELMKSLNADD